MTAYDRVAAAIAGDTYPRPVADFDDYYQEARLAAHLATMEWDPAYGVPEHAFVAQRVRWRVRDAQRRNLGRHHTKAEPTDPTILDTIPTTDDDDTWPLIRLVVQTMPRLPWLEEIVVTLHYCAGLTHRTIGKALGVSESRSCQISRAGVRHLRRLLV